MRNLWRSAAAAALVSGTALASLTLSACASPHYPTSADETRGPPPLTMPRPQYAPDAASAAAAAPAPAAPQADAAPEAPPVAAPVAPVESQSLPPASAAAPSASGPGPQAEASERLRPTPISTDPTPAPATSSAVPTSTAPVATALPAAAPAAATPAPAPPPAADEQGLTPQQVVHDQPGPAAPAAAAAPRIATSSAPSAPAAPPAERRGGGGAHLAIAGDVVSAHDEIFENYEVQKGDHIDALARAFSTTRSVLLDANDKVRPPYLLHPGEILKVPVAKAYVAQSGDTLTGVARRFAVSIGELAEINHLSEHGSLRAGQHIGLPSSMRDRGPQRIAEAEYAEEAPPTPRPAYRAPAYRPPAYTPPPYTPPPTPASSGGLTQVSPSGNAPIPERGSAGYQTPQSGSTTQAAPLNDSEVAAAAHGRFIWPVRGDIVARFGPQGIGRRNDGVDIKADQGSAVKAAAPGEVVYAGDQVPGFGNLVLIKHADGWVTAYAHLDHVDVQMRQQVTQGQMVGSVGMSGGAAQPELHFEVRYAPSPAEKAKPVDPVLVLPAG